ncbi:MAG: hypothetical protein AAFR33_07880 [Pseudomonadota bacterium]
MNRPLRLTLIDATAPTAFEKLGGGPPAVVQRLLDIEADDAVSHAPPVIACAEADVALARGAFVVSGDGDGVVIGLDPIGTRAARRALLAAFAHQHAPEALAVWVEAVTGETEIFQADASDIRFDTTDKRGMVIPNPQNWAAIIARMETAG